ncbi:manganese efflux pump MntP [Xanthobacter sp. TB0139]|uniref:manganese efflux pump MntP n=1 Tax=Xanthobacter sp. TB0139 TaxID=3459178 RepID=UPI0040395A9B
MSILAVIVLAFSMSMDAFVVSIGRGAAMKQPRYDEALRTGLIFGAVEATTPIIGWLAGIAASHAMQAVDHWIAFGLLSIVGLHMLIAAFREDEEDGQEQNRRSPAHTSFFVLVVTAIGTSLDAMAVGVSLAFLDQNILVVALAIGCATFIMSTTGILLGRMMNARWGHIAEACAGLILIGLGITILAEHLLS